MSNKEQEVIKKRKPGFKLGDVVIINQKGKLIKGEITNYNIKQGRRVFTCLTESKSSLLYLPVDDTSKNIYINSKLSKMYSKKNEVIQNTSID